MKIIDKLKGLMPVRLSDSMTPEMRLALTKERKRLKELVVDLHTQTQMLTKKDIGSWRMAWQQAIDVNNHNRSALYDVYTDVAVDLHVLGCMGQRKGMVLHRAFRMVDAGGQENPEATALLEAEWFTTLMNLVLDSRYWGHSLIELGDVDTVAGRQRFSSVSLIPRKHVKPEFGVIVRNVNDDHRAGVPYRGTPMADWLVEAGGPHDLGLLLQCAPSALAKKNMMAYWDGFGELFGMPIRIARTSSVDEKEKNRITGMLESMGAAPWALFPEGTDIEIKETTRGDAYNVYDRRIDRANSEISKGLLNQTMTIDSGSSLSQSQVHLEVFENVVENDARYLRNVINDQLLPLMVRHGFAVEGLRFEWRNALKFSPAEQVSVEQMLINSGYEIDAQYFIDKYGIPITGKGASPMGLNAAGGEPDFFA